MNFQDAVLSYYKPQSQNSNDDIAFHRRLLTFVLDQDISPKMRVLRMHFEGPEQSRNMP